MCKVRLGLSFSTKKTVKQQLSAQLNLRNLGCSEDKATTHSI